MLRPFTVEMPMPDNIRQPAAGNATIFPDNFCAILTTELEELHYKVEQWHPDGIDCIGIDNVRQFVNLTNLHRSIHNRSDEEMASIVREFLQILVRLAPQANQRLSRDLRSLLDRVRIRIREPFTGEDLPWEQKLEGTRLALSLVIDSSDHMAYITHDWITESGLAPEELVREGLANLRRVTPSDWLSTGPFGPILIGHSNDSYDASRSLCLAELRDTGRGGWLVAIPARDWLFALPATQENVAHFPKLKVLTEEYYRQEPYPISDAVYWLHDGQWEDFPINLSPDQVEVKPSAHFMKTLDLAASDKPSATAAPYSTFHRE